MIQVHNSWKIIFEDKTELMESDCQVWNNAPKDKKIEKVIFYFLNGYSIEFERFSNICVAKLGVGILLGQNFEHIGYVITVIYDNLGIFNNYRISNEGVKVTVGTLLELTVPQEYLRGGFYA